jgi:hypothetical protein
MTEQDFFESIGLETTTMKSTKGLKCADNFPQILDFILSEKISVKTKITLCSRFEKWCGIVSPAIRGKILLEHKLKIFDIIYKVASEPDDDDLYTTKYEGKQKYLESFVDGIDSAKKTDTSFNLANEFCPLSYDVVQKLLDNGTSFEERCRFTFTFLHFYQYSLIFIFSCFIS